MPAWRARPHCSCRWPVAGVWTRGSPVPAHLGGAARTPALRPARVRGPGQRAQPLQRAPATDRELRPRRRACGRALTPSGSSRSSASWGAQRGAPARLYLTGGATAVLEGWRGTTVDIDVHLEPDTDELLRRIPELKERLGVNVELASPAQFIPELPEWRERSRFIERAGALDVFRFDPYSQVLSKLERAFRPGSRGRPRDHRSRARRPRPRTIAVRPDRDPALPLSRYRPRLVPRPRRASELAPH